MACAGGPPVYCARQDWVASPGYPTGIAPSGITGVIGAGKAISGPVFGERIVRLTDIMAYGDPSQHQADVGFSGDYLGSDESEPISLNDDFFFVWDNGGNLLLYSFDPVSLVPKRLYQASYPSTNGLVLADGGKSAVWSPTQDDLLYEWGVNGSDYQIWHWTYSSLTTPPGSSTLDKDLTTDSSCNVLPSGPVWFSGLSISNSGDYFAGSASTGGQGTADIAVVWQKSTNKCAWINTQTGAYGGDLGGSGTISGWTAQYIHNLRLSGDGSWLRLDYQNNDVATWQVGTSTSAYCSNGTSPYPCNGGHIASGYKVFTVGNGINLSPSRARNYATHPWGSPLTFNFVYASGPPISPCANDTHVNWSMDNPSDNMPMAMSGDACGNNENAFVDEVNALAMNGSQMGWRFARTWSLENNDSFDPAHSIGQASRDGKFFMLATDWGGEFGGEGYSTISSWSRSGNTVTVTSSSNICVGYSGDSFTIVNAPFGSGGTSIDGAWTGNFTTIAAPTAAPTLSTATTGGFMAASSVINVTVTYETANGSCQTTPSSTASITTGSGTSTSTVTVTSPPTETNATYYGVYACAGASCTPIYQGSTAIGTNTTIGTATGSNPPHYTTQNGLYMSSSWYTPAPTKNGGNLNTMAFTQNAANDSTSTAGGWVLGNVCSTVSEIAAATPSCRYDAVMIEMK